MASDAEKLEKAEKVREKANVSFEEAREALEACGYDVLDAIVWLEQHGKTGGSCASYTTKPGEDPASDEMSRAQSAYEQSTKAHGVDVSALLNRFFQLVKRLFKKGTDTSFVAERNGKQVFSMPTLLLVLLLVLAFWVTLPLLVVGLFFNFRYHFEGIGAATVDINEVMGKVSEGAESIKRDVMGGSDRP